MPLEPKPFITENLKIAMDLANRVSAGDVIKLAYVINVLSKDVAHLDRFNEIDFLRKITADLICILQRISDFKAEIGEISDFAK